MNQELRIKNIFQQIALSLFILTSYFMILNSVPSAHAQAPSSLRVTPIIIPLSLSPNDKTEHTITLENLSNRPLPLRALFSDFEQATEDGGYLLQETNRNSLVSWLSLSQQEILIPPKGKQTITLFINTPKTIPLGGYYSLLFFEEVLTPNTKATTITSRIGVLILGDIGISQFGKQKIEILDFSLGNVIHQEQETPFLLRIENISLHHVNAKPQLLLSPLFGKPQKYQLDEKYIFPGKVRRWETTLRLDTAPIGIYEATIRVATGKGEQEIKKIVFISFPLTKVSITLLGFALLAWIIMQRKRLKTAVRILLKG